MQTFEAHMYLVYEDELAEALLLLPSAIQHWVMQSVLRLHEPAVEVGEVGARQQLIVMLP